jgi:hypothetical protein
MIRLLDRVIPTLVLGVMFVTYAVARDVLDVSDALTAASATGFVLFCIVVYLVNQPVSYDRMTNIITVTITLFMGLMTLAGSAFGYSKVLGVLIALFVWAAYILAAYLAERFIIAGVRDLWYVGYSALLFGIMLASWAEQEGSHVQAALIISVFWAVYFLSKHIPGIVRRTLLYRQSG